MDQLHSNYVKLMEALQNGRTSGQTYLSLTEFTKFINAERLSIQVISSNTFFEYEYFFEWRI